MTFTTDKEDKVSEAAEVESEEISPIEHELSDCLLYTSDAADD